MLQEISSATEMGPASNSGTTEMDQVSHQGAAPAVSAQQEALFDFAVSQSSAIFYIAEFGGDRRLRYISSNVEAITGHCAASFLDDSDFGPMQTHPDDRSAYSSALANLRKEGVASCEYRFGGADGTYRWYRDEIRLIGEEEVDSARYIGCMIDVHERVIAEHESKRLSALLHDAVESIPNGFGIYDSEDRLLLCNSSLAALFGETPEALVGSSAVDNLRRVLPQLKEVDGRRVSRPETSLTYALAVARKAERAPVEAQFKTGAWLQMTSHPVEGGGRVVIWTDISRLKNAESWLRHSEEQFRSIVEANPSPVRVADYETWEILYESPAAAALLGREWPATETHSTIDTYADMEAREEVVAKLVRQGHVDDHEVEIRRVDGSTCWVSLSARLVRYHGRRVCVTSLVDLTEMRKRESELRQARETLEDAIEALSDGFALYDADDCLLITNDRYRALNAPFEDLFQAGASWREIAGARAKQGFFADAPRDVEDWLDKQAARRRNLSDEEFALSNGKWMHVAYRRTRQGGFVHTWRDVTERRRMEQELRDSEARVHRILEACPAPITMNRVEDGVIIYESPAAQTLLKYEESQVGKSVVKRWADREDRFRYLERLKRTRAVDGLEVRFRTANSEDIWCALSSRLIDHRGEDVIVSSLYDLTDRRESEAELARQRELLHQSEKLSALGELLAGVSHELNNPLSVLVGQAHMLRENADDTRTAARAEKIGKAADRCARIVRTFLAMARREPTKLEPVDLNTILESALEVTAYSLRSSDVEVTLNMASVLPIVMADPDQLRQVFTNLIINAHHYLQKIDGPRQLRISSSYRKAANQVVFKIKDNGPGVSEEIRTRIFEPLFTTKEIGAGTGMGLALCHRILESHGGSIALERTNKSGASFVLRLPVGEEDTDENSEERPHLRRKAVTPACRVLVVDDDEDVGLIISHSLERDGHHVDVVGSGNLALEVLKRQSYDVILSDIRMPGMDGPAFYRALRDGNPGHIDGLAFITGDTLSPNVKQFLDASERPYLEKPVTPRDVRELVDLLLRRKV